MIKEIKSADLKSGMIVSDIDPRLPSVVKPAYLEFVRKDDTRILFKYHSGSNCYEIGLEEEGLIGFSSRIGHVFYLDVEE